MNWITLTQNLQRMYVAQQRTLTIDGRVLEFDAIALLLTRFFESNRVDIHNITTIVENQNTRIVTINGQMNFTVLNPNQAVYVAAHFSLVNDQPALIMEFPFIGEGTLAQLFPQLRYTLFDQIYYRDMIVRLASHQIQQTGIHAGMSMQGSLDLSKGAFTKLQAWLAYSSPLAVNLPLPLNPDYGPQIDLALPIDTAALTHTFPNTLSANLVHRYQQDSGQLAAGIRLTATFQLGAARIPCTGLFWDSAQTVLPLEAYTGTVDLPEPAALLTLFGGTDLIARLPPIYRSLQGIRVYIIRFSVGLLNKSVEYVDIILSSFTQVEVFNGRGIISDTSVSISFSSLRTANAYAQITLRGMLNVRNRAFPFQATAPHYLPMTATLEDEYDEDTGDLVQAATLRRSTLSSLFPHTALSFFADEDLFTDINLAFDSNQILALEASMIGTWRFQVGQQRLTIRDISLHLFRNQLDTPVERPLTGYTSIANIECTVVALPYDESWLLHAVPLAAGDFMWSDLAQTFAPTWTVPNFAFTGGFFDIDPMGEMILVSSNPAPNWSLGPLRMVDVGVYYDQNGAVFVSARLILGNTLLPVAISIGKRDPYLKVQLQEKKRITNVQALRDVLGGVDLSRFPVTAQFAPANVHSLRVSWDDRNNRLVSTRVILGATQPLLLTVGDKQVAIHNMLMRLRLDFARQSPIDTLAVTGTLTISGTKLAVPVLIDLRTDVWMVEKRPGLIKAAVIKQWVDLVLFIEWLLTPTPIVLAARQNKRIKLQKASPRASSSFDVVQSEEQPTHHAKRKFGEDT